MTALEAALTSLDRAGQPRLVVGEGTVGYTGQQPEFLLPGRRNRPPVERRQPSLNRFPPKCQSLLSRLSKGVIHVTRHVQPPPVPRCGSGCGGCRHHRSVLAHGRSRSAAVEERPPASRRIGVGGRGTGVAKEASRFGDVVAVCDVDLGNAERAKAIFGGKPAVYQDYRKLLDRKDIDVIINGTPDHWHTAINIAACKAGKDVYAEKPLTLTIDEGKILRKVVQETGRIVQVGTQQRSAPHFRTACELVRNGRIGKLRQVVVHAALLHDQGRPVRAAAGAAEAQLGPLARPGPRAPLLPAAAALQFPLVVGVCRRDHHRLGPAPHGHRLLGHGHGTQRARWRSRARRSSPTTASPTATTTPTASSSG